MRGSDLVERLAEFYQRFVKVAVYLGMQDFGGLILNCLDHGWMAVTGIGDGNAAGKIKIFCPLAGVNIAPFTPLDNQIGDSPPHGREMR